MKSLKQFLVYSNVLVAFCVLALALSSEVLLGSSNYSINQFVFFATLFTYNFQRIVQVKKGKQHIRKNWLEKYKYIINGITLISGLISAYHFFSFQLSTQIVIVFSGIISLLYPFGLRNIPFSKIFIISLVWVLSTQLLLILENDIAFSQNIILHLLARFLFVFAITIPFDIRDLKYDAEDLKTIPIIFGVSKAKSIAIFSLIIAMIIAVFQLLQHGLNSANLLALILAYFLAVILIKKSIVNSSEMYFSFWIESLSIFYYLFLVSSVLMF